jgi:uncharacterized protein YjcR
MSDTRIVVERTWRKSGANLGDQNRIKKLAGEKMPVIDIAKALDIDPNAVKSWVEHFGGGGQVGPNTSEGNELNTTSATKKKKGGVKTPTKKKKTPDAETKSSGEDEW